MGEVIPIPREEGDEGAAEWVAARMTSAQKSALSNLAALKERFWVYASDMGATGGTMRSMGDFARGKRGILPPLTLVRSDYSTEERCYHWQATTFGRRVATILAREKSQ